MQPNPKYSYTYQVASDNEQTYIAHQESRDGADVNGEYSFVNPLGQLITVTYTAGADGYLESRKVQDNFVTIRERPAAATAVAAPASGLINTVVEQVRPAVQTVVSQASSGGNDADLVARIIAQLTPFIRDTVSSSLQGGSSSSSSSVTTVQQQQLQQPVQAAPVVQQAVRPLTVIPSASSQASAVSSVFGNGGPNNVRFETPEFNFAYELERK